MARYWITVTDIHYCWHCSSGKEQHVTNRVSFGDNHGGQVINTSHNRLVSLFINSYCGLLFCSFTAFHRDYSKHWASMCALLGHWAMMDTLVCPESPWRGAYLCQWRLPWAGTVGGSGSLRTLKESPKIKTSARKTLVSMLVCLLSMLLAQLESTSMCIHETHDL